jgi:hypothetical protein
MPKSEPDNQRNMRSSTTAQKLRRNTAHPYQTRRKTEKANDNPELLSALAQRKIAFHNAKRPTKVEGRAVFNGNRPDFGRGFRETLWNDNSMTKICPKCKKLIDKKEKSLDHVKQWVVWIMNKVCAVEYCVEGVHWEFYWKDEVQAEYNNKINLQWMHGRCNSIKNGEKFHDGLRPQKRNAMPCDSSCSLRKLRG